MMYRAVVFIYFFLILSTLFVEQKQSNIPSIPIVLTIGIDKSINVEDIKFEEIQESLRDACFKWQETRLVYFKYNKKPDILITSDRLTNDRVAHYQSNKIVINNKIYPSASIKKWDKEYLTKVLVHEIGHALKLKHSTSPLDIMFYRMTQIDRPSEGDREQLMKILKNKNK